LAASGATTYTWTVGPNTYTGSTIPANNTVTAVYNVTGTDANSCANNATYTVNVNNLPTITVNNPTVCAGSPAILTASGSATSYTWSTSATTSTISVSPTVTTTYTVTGTDANTCTNTATGHVTAPANPMPFICMLTADSLAINNIIYWDRTLYANADSFIVYRYDAFTTNYFRIGAVSKDSSQFTDTARSTGGPNGGNPQYGSWQYKMAVKDTCGNISPKSPYHQSVFVQENFQNFNWNAYTIEAGQSNPVTGYSFLRDDINTGSWHILINTGGTSSTDPSYASYPNGNWRVDALNFNCTPTARVGNNSTAGTIIRSKSNISNNRATKNNQLAARSNVFTVYPNPSTGLFVIETNSSEKMLAQVYGTSGALLLSQELAGGKNTIDASVLPAGIYSISVSGKAGIVNSRLVIVK